MSETLGLDELRDAVRSVLADRAPDTIQVPGEEGRGLDHALWQEMAALGWLGLAVPEEHGGLGLGIAHLAVLYEELGRHMASVPFLETMIAATAIARHGDDAMRARWLPGIVAGDCLAAMALPEQSVVLGQDDRIVATIEHVPFADVATVLLLPVLSAAGTALAVLSADLPGVTVEARPLVDLTRSVGRIDVDAAITRAVMLALDPAEWDVLADHAAMGIACDAVGGAAALLDLTIEYLKVREQFGRPIGSFQALKHRAADWHVKIEATTALARHSAALLDTGDETASATASEAKAYACDTYAAFAGDAVQLHGGIGFTWDHPCHLFLKRAKLGQQIYGGSTAHKERAARFAFDTSVEDAPAAIPAPRPKSA